jgi:glycerophosphoryl diester phosphodiesterase
MCGQMDVLDNVRGAGPHLDVRYTIDEQRQWDGFLRRLDADPGLRGVSMNREFLSEEIARFIRENGLQVFCWTVDDPEEARRLVEMGVDGIISNSLPLLEALDGA